MSTPTVAYSRVVKYSCVFPVSSDPNRFYWVLSKNIKLARPTLIQNANRPESRISRPFLLAAFGIHSELLAQSF